MPNFSAKKKQSAPTRGTSKSNTVQKKRTPRKSPVKSTNVDADDVAVNLLDASEIEEEEEQTPAKVVSKAEPFTDGIVAACLKNTIAIERVGPEEVELLRAYISDRVTSGTYIGSIYNKSSFMRRKGGLLL